MDERKRKDLSRYRLERAAEELDISRHLLTSGNYNASANRSYYAIFHALRAVLALDGFDAKKHSSIISHFNRNYVKPGVFPPDTSKLIDAAFEVRGNADYKDYYVVTPEAAQKQINDAEAIINMITHYLESCWAEITKED